MEESRNIQKQINLAYARDGIIYQWGNIQYPINDEKFSQQYQLLEATHCFHYQRSVNKELIV